MNMLKKESFDQMIELMQFGQWSQAIVIFKSVNFSNRDFENWIEDLSKEDLLNITSLGFMSREFKPRTDNNFIYEV